MAEVKEPEWKGEERRGIPIHIINHIDGRLHEHIIVVDSSLEAIKRTLETNNKESEKRHTRLVDTITTYQNDVNALKTAFLLTDKGEPDYEGHRMFHYTAKLSRDWWEKTRQNAITKVIEWGTIGLLVWVVGKLTMERVT